MMKKCLALLLAVLMLATSALASEAPAIPQEAKTPARMLLDLLFSNDDADDKTEAESDGKMPKPAVYISKIKSKKGGALEITYRNDMDLAVQDISFILLTLNADGTLFSRADSHSFAESYKDSYSTVWSNSTTIRAGKSHTDTYIYNHDYGVRNFDINTDNFPVIAAGVTGWTTENGDEYRLSTAQMMLVGTDGSTIEPAEDPTQYHLLSKEELKLTGPITLGLTSLEVPAFLDDFYDEPTGMYIYRTTSSGIARKAGLQTGDVIISYNGKSAIEPHAAFACELLLLEGIPVEVIYWRNGEYLITTFQPPNR